ncbi:YqhA family protein [Rubrobacter radiotolerans]|uniref:YqhA family protein n=1 Tax=Rubrobacter radiotolerans TaxID=42256 RepID=A0AB35T8S0_RUBRA|nr:YqhA family protein [Rubrobacter radiotolerans]MDX5895362.1 YqhA family protein [Rubrobacter radiotolerans]SMC01703.1 Uncharacterized membrane protein YqhA [Rubrobacter radiotolerans DSM 5868]
MNRPLGFLERVFERLLWNSRLVMLVAVVASVLLALGAFYVALVDLVHLLGLIGDYSGPEAVTGRREALRADIITAIVKVLDGFFISAILIIVALGLYELFVNRIDPARYSETTPRILQIRDLDDLKERVAKLILLILTIEFFQRALRIPYSSALDLLYLGLAILFVSAALYLTSRYSSNEKKRQRHRRVSLERVLTRRSGDRGYPTDRRAGPPTPGRRRR